MFDQVLVPRSSLWSSVLLALVPLIVLLSLLAVPRMTAWLATIIASVITVAVAAWVWRVPFGDTVRAYFHGSLEGAWVVAWIVVLACLIVIGLFHFRVFSQVMQA